MGAPKQGITEAEISELRRSALGRGPKQISVRADKLLALIDLADVYRIQSQVMMRRGEE